MFSQKGQRIAKGKKRKIFVNGKQYRWMFKWPNVKIYNNVGKVHIFSACEVLDMTPMELKSAVLARQPLDLTQGRIAAWITEHIIKGST